MNIFCVTCLSSFIIATLQPNLFAGAFLTTDWYTFKRLRASYLSSKSILSSSFKQDNLAKDPKIFNGGHICLSNADDQNGMHHAPVQHTSCTCCTINGGVSAVLTTTWGYFTGSFLSLTAATQKLEKRRLTMLWGLSLPHKIESAKQK